MTPSTGHRHHEILLPGVRSRQWVVIESIRGRAGVGRLADLGLMPGVAIQVIRGSRRGPVLVQVKRSRLALGAELARMIRVSLLHKPSVHLNPPSSSVA